MKLSKTQKELLQEMQSGKKLHYMLRFNPGPYYLCGMRRCTKAAKALMAKGLVESFGSAFRPSFRLTAEGLAFNLEAA